MPRKIPSPEPSLPSDEAEAASTRRADAGAKARGAGKGREAAAASPAKAPRTRRAGPDAPAASKATPAAPASRRPPSGATTAQGGKAGGGAAGEEGAKGSPKASPKGGVKGGAEGRVKGPATRGGKAALAAQTRSAPPTAGKAPAQRSPKAKPAPASPASLDKPQGVAPRRNKAVANAAAAARGKSLIAWSAEEITEAFTRFEAQDPEPRGELDHTDSFTLLVAVVLSAQATDSGVNRATKGLFGAASTPAAMVALGEAEVARHIRTLGLYRNKAKNVVELSRLLLERHAGIVPQDRAALEALPGVGRKTANVVLNIAFGAPTIAVDTHLFRVANRTGLAPGATPLQVEEGLEARIPDRFKLHAHHWLILHGRYICKARLPECGHCIIADLCRWPDKHF